MSATLISQNALALALAESPEYKALLVKFEKQALEALSSTFEVKSLGVTMTLAQVAVTYQAYKGIPKAFGESGRSFAEAISRECLAIIKSAGFKADFESIKGLTA